ncbi:DNA cytosine methyltransferase [Brevibacillus sp. SYSU BS000544]|uniref:DNA cytosine methyltransferase n=1 Tax=Brevibacillus sp. SYSU BS000544 TaxID=3416443 RepID=UPI003CE5BD29
MTEKRARAFSKNCRIISIGNYLRESNSTYEINSKMSTYWSNLMKPIAIDLFCGAGGMSEGILQAGFHIVFSSDINESVQQTYLNRHEQLGLHQGINTHFELSDVRELSGGKILSAIKNLELFKERVIPTIDVIFGGPPCQGFSRAGQRMKDDPRNLLFREYLRIVNEIRPKYVVMENVEGFLDTKLQGYLGVKGKTYEDDMFLPDILLEEFNQIGYLTLKPRVLDASDFGVPQRRRRVIFIAYAEGQPSPQYPEPITPSDNQKVTVLEAIGDLIVNPSLLSQVAPKSSVYQRESKDGRTPTTNNLRVSNHHFTFNHALSKHSLLITERFSLFRQGESSAMLMKRILEEGIDLRKYPSLLQECQNKLGQVYDINDIVQKFSNGNINDKMIESLLTKKNSRIRLLSTGLAPTMVTLPDDFLSPFEDRILTVREMARFQSFDDSFEFLGKRTTGGHRRKVEVPQYTQVGNAVPPLLAKSIALEIKKAIQRTSDILTAM